jgi:hypothetical protein
MENKEKQVINATEPRTTFIPVESRPHITMCQRCLLCENTREFINGYPPGPSPWVCDECREVIAFVKDLRASAKDKEVSEEESKEIKASIALL